MKVCKKCGLSKPEEDFELYRKASSSQQYYRRNTCNKCKNRYDYERTKETGQYEVNRSRARKRRHDPRLRAGFLFSDIKNYDRYHHLETDLDKETIENLIIDGCFYCGFSEPTKRIKIGLDRIDNSKGHTKDNVNACCSRCNFIRRTLPYDVWLLLVPAIRTAVEAGMLDDWDHGYGRYGGNYAETI